jgi:Colicin D
MKIDPRTLQHTFGKHALDFGVSGPWNQANAVLLEQAIKTHLTSTTVQAIPGTFRGTISVTHYFDPATGLDVMEDALGNFLGGWKLSNRQMAHLRASGNVQ